MKESRKSPIQIKYTILDLYSVLFRKDIDPKPKRKPNVWEAANRYPAEEPSSIGKTTYEAYEIMIEGAGIVKKPTQAPRTIIFHMLLTLKRKERSRSEAMKKPPKLSASKIGYWGLILLDKL